MRRALLIAGVTASLMAMSVGATAAQNAMDLWQAIDFATGRTGEPGSIPEFWSASFPEAQFGDYRDPTVIDLTATGPGSVSGCGAAADVAGNAVYCPSDESITYDPALLAYMHDAFGSASTFAVLAHEWGHHIQALSQSPIHDERAELQADCYAGMYVGHLIDEGALDEEDVLASLALTESVGDDALGASYVDWRDSGVHGDRHERRQAFGIGYTTGSFDSCLAYGGRTPQDPVPLWPGSLVGNADRELYLPPTAYVTIGRDDSFEIPMVDAVATIWTRLRPSSEDPLAAIGPMLSEALAPDVVEVSDVTEGWLDDPGWTDGRGARATVTRQADGAMPEVGSAAIQIHDDGSSELFTAFVKPGSQGAPVEASYRALQALSWGYCDRSAPNPDNCPAEGTSGAATRPLPQATPRPAPTPQPPPRSTPKPTKADIERDLASTVSWATWEPYRTTPAGVTYDPFKYGAITGILLDGLERELDPRIDFAALFRFPDAKKMDRYWEARAGEVASEAPWSYGPCRDGRAGRDAWAHGEYLCYVSDAGVSVLRWTDERTNTYGVVNATKGKKDLAQLHEAWVELRL